MRWVKKDGDIITSTRSKPLHHHDRWSTCQAVNAAIGALSSGFHIMQKVSSTLLPCSRGSSFTWYTLPILAGGHWTWMCTPEEYRSSKVLKQWYVDSEGHRSSGLISSLTSCNSYLTLSMIFQSPLLPFLTWSGQKLAFLLSQHFVTSMTQSLGNLANRPFLNRIDVDLASSLLGSISAQEIRIWLSQSLPNAQFICKEFKVHGQD